jgi:hypothetical protein
LLPLLLLLELRVCATPSPKPLALAPPRGLLLSPVGLQQVLALLLLADATAAGAGSSM